MFSRFLVCSFFYIGSIFPSTDAIQYISDVSMHRKIAILYLITYEQVGYSKHKMIFFFSLFLFCSAARGLINHILYESEKISGRKFTKTPPKEA